MKFVSSLVGALAVLALGQRGKLGPEFFADVPEADLSRVLYLLAIMRLASCFKYVEKLELLPNFTVVAREKSLSLAFPARWLQDHPLTAGELETEQAVLGKVGLKLKIS